MPVGALDSFEWSILARMAFFAMNSSFHRWPAPGRRLAPSAARIGLGPWVPRRAGWLGQGNDFFVAGHLADGLDHLPEDAFLYQIAGRTRRHRPLDDILILPGAAHQEAHLGKHLPH